MGIKINRKYLLFLFFIFIQFIFIIFANNSYSAGLELTKKEFQKNNQYNNNQSKTKNSDLSNLSDNLNYRKTKMTVLNFSQAQPQEIKNKKKNKTNHNLIKEIEEIIDKEQNDDNNKNDDDNESIILYNNPIKAEQINIKKRTSTIINNNENENINNINAFLKKESSDKNSNNDNIISNSNVGDDIIIKESDNIIIKDRKKEIEESNKMKEEQKKKSIGIKEISDDSFKRQLSEEKKHSGGEGDKKEVGNNKKTGKKKTSKEDDNIAKETKEKGINNKDDIYPELLTEKEVKELRDMAIKYKRSLEKEEKPTGIIRQIYADNKKIYHIKMKVNYSTVLTFQRPVTLKDITIGSDIVKVEQYRDRFIILYPTSPFKNTNMTIFYNDTTLNFIIEEEMDENYVDFRVDVLETPQESLSIGEIFKILKDNYVPDIYKYQSAKVELSKPICNFNFCKNIESVIEVFYPNYVKGFKILMNDSTIGIKGIDAMYVTSHNNYYYLFFHKNKGQVKKGEVIYEIY